MWRASASHIPCVASVSEPHSMCGECQRATFSCGERSEPPLLSTRSRPRPRVGGWRAWAGTSAALADLGGHAVRLTAQVWHGCTSSLGCFGGRAVRPYGIVAEQPLLLFSANSYFVLLPLAFAGLPDRASLQGQNGYSTHPLLCSAVSFFALLPLAFLGCPLGHAQEGKTATAPTFKANNE